MVQCSQISVCSQREKIEACVQEVFSLSDGERSQIREILSQMRRVLRQTMQRIVIAGVQTQQFLNDPMLTDKSKDFEVLENAIPILRDMTDIATDVIDFLHSIVATNRDFSPEGSRLFLKVIQSLEPEAPGRSMEGLELAIYIADALDHNLHIALNTLEYSWR